MAQPNTNQKKRKAASGLPTAGPQAPSWYGSQQQQVFPTVPAYTRTTSQPNVAVSGLSSLLDMFSGAGNRARLGMRQNLNYNNLPGRTPPPGTPDYNLPRMSHGQTATPQLPMAPQQQSAPMLQSQQQYAMPAGPAASSGYAVPVANGLPQSFTEGILNAGVEQMRRQEALIQATPANRLQRPDPYATGIRQGNYDVAQASITGIPQGGMTVDQTRDAYLTQQRIQAAQAAQEAQRGMLGPGPSGIPLAPRDAAAQGNMNQGTPWQPVPGTVGLPAFVPQAELDRKIYDARRADEAQRFADFTANMSPTASYYEGMGRGRQRPMYEDTQAYAAMKERAAATRPQRESERLNQRAAVYARAHGLPMNTALLQLTAMDEQGRAAGEDRQPNLSRDQRMANPAMAAAQTADDQMGIARQNALSNALAGLGNYAGTLTPELLGSVVGAFPQPVTGLPVASQSSPLVTPDEEIEKRRLAAVQSGDNRQAQLEVERANTLNEIATRDDIPSSTRQAVIAAAQAGNWDAVSRLLQDSIGIEAFEYMNRMMDSGLYSPNNPTGSTVADEALASPNANFLQSLLYHFGRMGTSGAPMAR